MGSGIPRLVLTTSLVVAVALALALGVPARSASSAPARWIVFAATLPGQHTNQLFRIQSSGGGLKQLTHGTLSSIAPNFSLDGKQIVFARFGVGILTEKIDGTGLRRLTTNGRDSLPAWSPDGTRIAFVRPDKNGWHIYVMSSSSGTPQRLPKAPPSGRPSWTASGLLIPSGGDLLRIDVTTGHVQKYYGATIDVIWGLATVAVSPDASTITYAGARNVDPGDTECGEAPCERFALYVENVIKGKQPKLLTKDAAPATFSPDGKQVVFVAKNALVVWTLANRKTRVISTGKAFPSGAAPPAWQPR